MIKRTIRYALGAAGLLSLASLFPASAVFAADSSSNSGIQREVRHELVTLSRYGVFDNLEYAVNGSEVTLKGQVVLPVLKDDAEHAVKKVPGVTRVNNQIQVLPVSPMDDGIRRAVYRAIYG